MSTVQGKVPDWLDLHSAHRYQWRQLRSGSGDQNLYCRPLGIVESLFDSDGNDYEGRADLNVGVHAEFRTKLDPEQLRSRITLVWTLMCHSHILLSATSQYGKDFLPGAQGCRWIDKYFVYRPPQSIKQAVLGAQKQLTFVEDTYPSIDPNDFWKHLTNTSRVFHSTAALSRLFVLPTSYTQDTTSTIYFVLVAAHQIADGLTVCRWASDLVEMLNVSNEQLQEKLQLLIGDVAAVRQRLPPAQEALYPTRGDRVALRRWQWLISRVIRSVRKPPPPSFLNPLRRETPLSSVQSLPNSYDKILNYESKMPLNSYSIAVKLSKRATHNLAALCRGAGISLGSGCFTLVAMVMMHFEEERCPDIPEHSRLPFVAGFPVNPRPFLTGTPTTGKEDSLMLAFSDGVTLPFLTQERDFSGRFKLLGKSAHRQLRQYQKRKRSLSEEVHLGSRSTSQLLPGLFLATLERMEAKAMPEHKVGFDVQSALPAKQKATLATCGISSVGDRTGLISAGKHDVSELGQQDLVADFREINSSVRAREAEFLVGASGDKNSLDFVVSYDGCYIDPSKVERWKNLLVGILDFDMPTSQVTRTQEFGSRDGLRSSKL